MAGPCQRGPHAAGNAVEGNPQLIKGLKFLLVASCWICWIGWTISHHLDPFGPLGKPSVEVVEGWAIFERLELPCGESFVAMKYAWSATQAARVHAVQDPSL